MAETYAMQISAIAFKDVGAPAAGEGTAITGVQESFTITQADATITDIMSEFTDTPLVRSINAGLFEFSFSVAGIDYSALQPLMGGTWTAGSSLYALPTTASIITKKFKITFGNGIKDMVVYKGQVATKFEGSDLKSNPLKVTFTVTALADATGFVDFNSGATARTTW